MLLCYTAVPGKVYVGLELTLDHGWLSDLFVGGAPFFVPRDPDRKEGSSVSRQR